MTTVTGPSADAPEFWSLSADQLTEIEEAFDAARERKQSPTEKMPEEKKRPKKSGGSKPPDPSQTPMPEDAGRRLKEALPRLMREIDLELLHILAPRMSRGSFADIDRKLEAAESALREVCWLQGVNDEAELWFYRHAFVALMLRREKLAAQQAVSMLAADVPKKPFQRKGGRTLPAWRAVMLTQLAAWWFKQGWRPTQQKDGCFLVVAGLLRDYRTGISRWESKGWNAQIVKRYIEAGRLRHEEEERST